MFVVNSLYQQNLYIISIILIFDLLNVWILKLMLNYFDKCDKKENTYLFCKKCYNSMNKIKIFKFDSINMINVTFCQIYFVVFQNLTLIQKTIITRAHSIISILKFRSYDFDDVAFYQQIREHAVIFFFKI